MSLINKLLAILMLPLGILIVLESAGIYALGIGMDKAFIGAILMIVLQVMNIVMLKVNSGEFRLMNGVALIEFVIPAVLYLISEFISIPGISTIPMILGIMMVVEAIYGLH